MKSENQKRAEEFMNRWFNPVGSAMKLVTAALVRELDEAEERGRGAAPQDPGRPE